ncbi:ubiquitin-like protein Pup [Gleimia europaea]|uniref:Prokaryotic ubiquitin-like protein Pup n=1 Tax=Gleimia europaea ACS-120-V-Col10b TaxID=883069 RepID=A0A9W5RDT1_9ACTO|nr:ubiquitin-like protein Pup [Gleimia europaea]EPD30535.1 ubiquitin-like protein Pup [Gleimia europaea ACS-120-V-Col10b]
MAQKFAPAGGSNDDEIFEAGQVQAQGASIDDLLDEIDSVLEADAQKFVQGFVQKGGE